MGSDFPGLLTRLPYCVCADDKPRRHETCLANNQTSPTVERDGKFPFPFNMNFGCACQDPWMAQTVDHLLLPAHGASQTV